MILRITPKYYTAPWSIGSKRFSKGFQQHALESYYSSFKGISF